MEGDQRRKSQPKAELTEMSLFLPNLAVFKQKVNDNLKKKKKTVYTERVG